MHRLVILLALITAVELLSYQAVIYTAPDILPGAPWLLHVLFWSVTTGAIMMIMFWARGVLQRWSQRALVWLRTYIFIFFLAKLVMAAVVLLELLRRFVAWALNAVAAGGFSEGYYLPMLYAALVAGLIPVIVLTYGMIRNPHRYRVRRLSLTIPDLHPHLEGLSIVQLSDIHCGSFLSYSGVEKGVRIARDLEPDLLLFTGDLVNNAATEADPYVDLLGSIEAKYGRFSICGNHDYGDYIAWASQDEKKANFTNLTRQHQRIGWKLLLNGHEVLPVGEARLGIVGVENYSAHPRFQKYGDLAKATRDMPDVDFCILMSHDPSHWTEEVTSRYPDIDLTLSGHTHGFQFGVDCGPKLRWSPVRYVYKQWIDLYTSGKQSLYVNRGFGFLGYPGRVGILPEITQITLSGDYQE